MTTQNLPSRRAAFGLLTGGALALAGCSSGKSDPGDNETASAPTTSVAPTATATKGGGSVPTRLQIPSIGFDKKVTGMGLTASGEISPPAGVTQWYNATVAPGQPGISVIAGHVTYNGPDVFEKLEQVKVGDSVTVGFADGSSKKFVVTREKSVGKTELQHDATVWGTSSTPVLTLITCDAGSKLVGRHHVNNFVVWTKPV